MRDLSCPLPLYLCLQREEFLAESASSIVKASSNSNSNGQVEDVGPFDNYDGIGSDGGYSSDGGGGGGGGGGYGDYGDHNSDVDGEGFHDGAGGDAEGGQVVGVAPISLEDAFRDKPQTYEDLCRSHIVSIALLCTVVPLCRHCTGSGLPLASGVALYG